MRGDGRSRTSRELHEASALLIAASARLARAGRELGAMNQCLRREPENAGDAPRFLVETTGHWAFLTAWLGEVADDPVGLRRETRTAAGRGVRRRRERMDAMRTAARGRRRAARNAGALLLSSRPALSDHQIELRELRKELL